MLNDVTSSLVQNLLLPTQFQTDPVRKESRVKMRVTVRPLSTSLPLADGSGANYVKQGTHEILVYESDVPKVLAKVEEDPEGIARAELAYDLRLRAWLREKQGRMPLEDKSLWDSKTIDLCRQYNETNVPAEFYAAHLRSIRPLVSAEVLERVEAPETPQEKAQREQMAMLADMVRSIGGNSEADELRKQVAELSAQVAKLLKQSKG